MSWNIAKPGDQINGPVAVTGNLNVDSNTLFVDSANNRVGVLTASPTVPLDVVGDAKVSGNLTVDTNTLVVDAANNRLGIGTATPASALDVVGTGIISQNLGIGAAPSYKLHVTQGDLNSYVVFQNNQTLAQYRSMQMVLGNGPSVFGANNRDWRVLNVASSATASDIVVDYWTGTAISEKFKIASDGVCTWSNVVNAGTAMTLNASGLGIGATPATGNSAGLTVGAIGAPKNLTLSMYQANARIREWDATNTVALVTNINVDNVIDNNTLSSWKVQLGSGLECFRVARAAAGSTTFAEFFRVDNAGNVGIGTPTPSYKLDVNGGIASNNGTIKTGIAWGAGGVIGTFSNHNLAIITNDATVATFTTSGNLGIGTATIPERLTVSGNVLATDSAGTYPRFISTVGAKSWEIGYRSGTTNYELREDGTTRLVVANGGNCGIGTTTPLFKLDVRGGSIYVERSSNPTNGILIQASNQTTTSNNGCKISFDSYNIGAAGAGVPSGAQALAFYVGGVADANEKARIDTAGNVGISCTPSVYGSTYRTICIGNGANHAVFSGSSNGDGGANSFGTSLMANNSYDWPNNKAVGLGAAAFYLQSGGRHSWYSAPSVAAGALQSSVLTMTLDASGRLGIGITPAAILHVEGSAAQARFSVASATDARHEYYRNSVREAYIGWDANDFAIFATQANGVLRFGSGNTERLRIKSTGQLNFTGLASDPAGAAGDVYYNSGSNVFKVYDTGWKTLSRKYVVQLSDGSVTVVGNAYTLTHNFASKDVTISIRRTTDDAVVLADVTMPTTNTATVTFASAITAANYYVTVIG